MVVLKINWDNVCLAHSRFSTNIYSICLQHIDKVMWTKMWRFCWNKMKRKVPVRKLFRESWVKWWGSDYCKWNGRRKDRANPMGKKSVIKPEAGMTLGLIRGINQLWVCKVGKRKSSNCIVTRDQEDGAHVGKRANTSQVWAWMSSGIRHLGVCSFWWWKKTQLELRVMRAPRLPAWVRWTPRGTSRSESPSTRSMWTWKI